MDYELYRQADVIVRQIMEYNRIKTNIRQEIANNDLESLAKSDYYSYAKLEGLQYTIDLLEKKIKELNDKFESL